MAEVTETTEVVEEKVEKVKKYRKPAQKKKVCAFCVDKSNTILNIMNGKIRIWALGAAMMVGTMCTDLCAERLVILSTNDTHSQIVPDAANQGGILRRRRQRRHAPLGLAAEGRAQL